MGLERPDMRNYTGIADLPEYERERIDRANRQSVPYWGCDEAGTYRVLSEAGEGINASIEDCGIVDGETEVEARLWRFAGGEPVIDYTNETGLPESPESPEGCETIEGEAEINAYLGSLADVEPVTDWMDEVGFPEPAPDFNLKLEF